LDGKIVNMADGTINLNYRLRVDENHGLINIMEGVILVSNGTLDNYGTINSTKSYSDAEIKIGYNGILNNYSTILLSPNKSGHYELTRSIQIQKGELHNYGTIDIPANGHIALGWPTNPSVGDILENHTDGHIINRGIISIYWSDAVFINHGVIDNWGEIRTSDFISPDFPYEVNYGTINNYGLMLLTRTLEYINEGTIVNNGEFVCIPYVHDGTLKGTGTFMPRLYTTGILGTGSGTVAPGDPVGTMYVKPWLKDDGEYLLEGDYYHSGAGTLEIEIGGFDPGESDLLDVAGTARMTGGTVKLLFAGGYDITSDVAPGETKTVEFLKADTIESFDSAVVYDFLGTPAGFVYYVYQQGNSLIFEATNTGAVYYSAVCDSPCEVKFEDAVDYEGYEDSLGEDGAVETEHYIVSVENACDGVDVFIKAGKNKSGATITGDSGSEMVGDFLLEWTRTGDAGAYTYNFALTSDDDKKTKALGYILFDFCMDGTCPDAEVISPTEGQYAATRESD
jgi:hypothetical protein